MCIRSKVHLAIVDQCNQAILFHKRRPTINSQIMAEEVLTTCSGICDHAGFIDLNALIQKALVNIEKGQPQTIPTANVSGEKPQIGKIHLSKNLQRLANKGQGAVGQAEKASLAGQAHD